jgi:hypothetical protein
VAVSKRSTQTASLVLLVTTIYGVIAFVLIEQTKIAVLCTALIFFSAITRRMFERDGE